MNLRPLGYEPNELPGCSTPRQINNRLSVAIPPGGVNGPLSPDGTRFATGSSDNTLRLWDWRSCANVLSLPFAAAVYELAWSPDGARLLAAPLDGTVVRLDASPVVAR